MSQLEELKRQRKELDRQIKELQAEHKSIVHGDCTFRFYNKNFPQHPEQITLSLQRYGAFGRKGNQILMFQTDNKEDAIKKLESLINDMKNVLQELK